ELLEMAGGEIDRAANTPVAAGVNLTSVPGVFACGNACKVYDLVDWVTRDSALAGRMAAEYLEKK
ncbi:MAG: pyridine nucleotide-disulfide oxidoreductase, partial [Elusimicrobia bacterium]|nr:pyridine nucleotide-disulfide oxidoreductase [Elusimicrobiota bacterium]